MSVWYSYIAPVIMSVIPRSRNAPPTTPDVDTELTRRVVLSSYPSALQLMTISSLSLPTVIVLLALLIEPSSPSPILVRLHFVSLGSSLNASVWEVPFVMDAHPVNKIAAALIVRIAIFIRFVRFNMGSRIVDGFIFGGQSLFLWVSGDPPIHVPFHYDVLSLAEPGCSGYNLRLAE
jgi:hypothetical protein